ncbi:hypothetical protein LCGC14_0350260 [marine sediment metagenome]|uniref:Uncharacterized protein n=1 Tax=marine sediment metagenome TaxID=412755 RepID=A0A0F9TGV8_9ZZZZ
MKNNSTECDFLDKYNVNAASIGKGLVTLEDGTVCPEADLCLDYCPYKKCVLIKGKKKGGIR